MLYWLPSYFDCIVLTVVYCRTGFKGGGPGDPGPRPPTNRGPPTKPFILFSVKIVESFYINFNPEILYRISLHKRLPIWQTVLSWFLTPKNVQNPNFTGLRPGPHWGSLLGELSALLDLIEGTCCDAAPFPITPLPFSAFRLGLGLASTSLRVKPITKLSTVNMIINTQ